MQPPTANTPPPLPAEATRTVVNLLLFMHLCMVVVALVSYPSPSGLQVRLNQVFGPYVSALNFDLNHGVYSPAKLYLTHATPSDIDFQVTITPQPGSGPPLVIPEPRGRWTLGYRRQLALANTVGGIAVNESVNDEIEGVLPKSLASAVLTSTGARRSSITVRGRYLPTQQELASTDPSLNNPDGSRYFRNVYEAQVFVTGGQVNLLKTSAAGEVAPVESRPAR